MLGRFKNPVVALGLLILPVSSVCSMLDRFKNPVVALELSKRHKSKAYVIAMIAVYAVYAVYSLFVLVGAVMETRSTGYSYRRRYYPGDYFEFNDLLTFTVWPVVVMIFLVVPVLAATSVVGERRRGTLMPVQLSSLRPLDIVWGKVIASVAPVLLPVVVCVVVLVAFSLEVNMDIVNVYRLLGSAGVGAGLVVLSMAVSVVCVLCSTFAKSSASAITMSYGLFLLSLLSFGGIVIALPFGFLEACKRLRLPPFTTDYHNDYKSLGAMFAQGVRRETR